MLNRRTVLMFIIAMGLAAGAAWMANRWLQARAGAPPEVATLPVVVAALQISYAQKIEAVQVKTVAWPRNGVPPESFDNTSLVVGKIANRTFYPGEVVLKHGVAEYLGGSALSAFIKPQMRAVSVPVNDVTGVGGFVLPGNYVDVLCPSKDGGIVRTVLEHIKVLAVDQESSPDKSKPTVVRAATLEMSPEQAEILVAAIQGSKVHLALRNPLDDKEGLRPKQDPPKAEPVRKEEAALRPRTFIIIRGASVSEMRAGL